MSTELNDYLGQRRTLVEERLRANLRLDNGCPPILLEAMRYSLLAPGKRLRPLLVILAAEGTGGGAEKALPAACAVEMVHAYSLIHDDLPAMDNDDVRRGLPTCHRQFGEAMAILAGDALLTLAFQVLATGYRSATAAGCCRELALGAGAAGMVGGQVEDLAWEQDHPAREQRRQQASSPTLEALENIHARKTGALIRACLRLGVWTAQGERPTGPDPMILESLDAYGRCFGQAFQITDDLLDIEGAMAQTGKRVQKDADRGKLTYPSYLGVAESRRRAEALCAEARLHLRLLGPAGDRLGALTQLILERDR